jgi:hypothetical protein
VLGAEAPEEAVDYLVVVGECVGVLFAEVDEHSGVHTGDAVEDGLGEVHLPLVFPGGEDVLHLGVCIYYAVAAESFAAFADFFLVHREDVEGLVELDAFAETDVFGVVPVYHAYYNAELGYVEQGYNGEHNQLSTNYQN